ncbi:MAG: right-handed parallel beta-helix repeat-containing protein [Candidatus Anammoxibacter sp.]
MKEDIIVSKAVFILIILSFISPLFLPLFHGRLHAREAINCADNIRSGKPLPVIRNYDYTRRIPRDKIVLPRTQSNAIDDAKANALNTRTKRENSRTPSRLDLGITSSTVNVPGNFNTIQSAIDAALDGDTILVSPGTYKETIEIIDKDITLKGQNKDSTIINGENLDELSTIFASGGNVSISGFTIMNGGFDGVEIIDSEESMVFDNIIKSSIRTGLFIQNSTVSIIKNIIIDNNSRGIEAQEESNVEIIDNLIEGNSNIGVAIFNTTCLIDQNTIGDNGFRGLNIRDSLNIDVTGNIIEGNADTGVFIFNTTGLVGLNTINDNGFRGLGVEDDSNIDITDNIIERNVDIGVFISNATGLVNRNTVRDNGSRGLNIQTSSNINITGNLFEGNAKTSNFLGGITIINTDTVLVADNVINANNIGLWITEATSVDVSDNIIDGNAESGILISTSRGIEIIDNQITDTKFSGGFGRGVSITNSSILLKGNDISSNTFDDGLIIFDIISIVEIVGNSINNNGNNGVRCIRNPVITGCCNTVEDNIRSDLLGCPSTILSCPCPEGGQGDTLSVTPLSALLTRIDSSVQLTAIIEGANGATVNVTDKAIWSSSDNNITTINAGGLVTAISNGEATVCAEFNQIEACIETNVNTVHFGINQWTVSNESEKLGIINDIVIDLENTDIIYIATNSGEIFKSFDKGETWQNKSEGLRSDSILALAIDPDNPDILYAGGADTIYKSSDGGEIWLQEKTGIFTNSLVINPIDTNTIYAGTEGNGILKSEDGGETFKIINQLLRFKSVRTDSIVINPLNPEILYVAVDDGEGTGKGVFKTSDGGRKWKRANKGLPKDVQGLAINPVNPDILYAGTLFKGVFKTTNGGANWFELKNSPHKQNLTLAVDNLNPDVIYVGNFGQGVSMTRDGGLSWITLNTQLTSRTINALTIDPIKPSTIYAGSPEGVFRFVHTFDDIIATANPDGSSIDIKYQFNEETDIEPIGFNIYRSTSEDGDFEKITDELQDPKSTGFNDQEFLEGAAHVYRVTVVDKNGETLKSFAVSAKPLLESNPDFKLEAIENEKEVISGESVSFPLTISSLDNFAKEVFFAAANLPADVSVEFIPESGVPPLAVRLNINTGASTPTGVFDAITVTATAGEKTVAKIVKLNVIEKDSNKSRVTQTVNTADISVGNKVEIAGKIIPLQIGASITTTFESPGEETSNETSITNANGRYSVIKQLNKSGTWKITTSWDGNEKLTGASSQAEDIFVAQAVTTISMVTDATSETENGDTLVLTGNISPNPGEGKLFLEINNLDGSINFNSIISISTDGTFTHEFNVAGGENGEVKIFARFSGTDDYGGSEKSISVPIQEPVGMSIIVAGGGNGEENILWEAANNLCNYVYTVIKSHGIPDTKENDRIFYLHPDPDNDADGDGISDTDREATSANLKFAIEEWALGLADVSAGNTIKVAPLTIYMMGPGGIDRFEIDKDDDVTAADLKRWLNNLYTDVSEKFEIDSFPVNVIIESPQSGSFIDDLRVENGIGDGRVVVTSTDHCKEDTETCNAGEINVAGDGSISFTKQFFFGIKIGKSITTSWAESNLTIQGLFDDQRPQLDADGNGVANEDEDETTGSRVFINQNRVPENKNNKNNLRVFQESPEQATFDAQSFIVNRKPVISGSQKDLVVKNGATSATLWAIAEDPDDGIKDVQALLFSPKSSEPEILNLQFSEKNNRYETTFKGFSLFGLYEALFVARDKSNNTSLPARTSINSQTIIPALLKGKVTGKTTGEPLEKVKVWLQGVRGSASTDKNGNYLIQADQGVHTVFAEKEGFKLKTAKNFRLDSASRTLNIELEPAGADTSSKSFTFNCEHGFKRGSFLGLEKLTLALGDTENCTLKLTDREPGKTVEISTLLRNGFRSAIEIAPAMGVTDENGELEISITAIRKGKDWAAWAVPNDRGIFKFNKKTYDTGLAWGMFVEVK